MEPQAVFTDSPIVRGTDGGAKMSKSLGNTIDIFGDDAAVEQVMGMVTDTQRIEAHNSRSSRSATCARCIASSAPTTTRPSGTASARHAPGRVD
ncbi:MAG: hypothetical protein R3C32_06430 [Chloroflexota bacterium]